MRMWSIALVVWVAATGCSSKKSEPKVVPVQLPKFGLVIELAEGSTAEDAHGVRSDYLMERPVGPYIHVQRDELTWTVDDLKESLKKTGTLLSSEVLPDGWLAETKIMGDRRVEVHRTIGTPYKCSGQYDEGDDAERLRIRTACLSLRAAK